ncbi:MazG-like family protein [Streptomyces sp. NPDC051597]|uniref:MazG-like family protein n=1 Tax=Streptomyces sp. NPDC051597 TaxID=3155049 RepID=UPI00342110A5
MINQSQWSTIRALVAWLDAENGRSEHEITLRLLKLAEEVGEVTQARIGMTGQNPRKGVTHTAGDVADELVDVMVTAAVALVSLDVDDPAALVAAKLGKIAARVGVQPEPPVKIAALDPRAVEQAVQRLVVQAANWPRGGVR